VVANVAVKRDGSIFTAGHVTDKSASSGTPVTDFSSLSKIDAVIAASRALGHNVQDLKKSLQVVDDKVTGASFTMEPIRIELQYFQKADGSLELVYNLNIHEETRWYNFTYCNVSLSFC
jgi:hypothetical protein